MWSGNYDNQSVKLLFPPDGFVFDTHTDIQNEFISRIEKDGTGNALLWLKDIKGEMELSSPRCLRFTWESTSSEENVFELSKTSDFLKTCRVLRCAENFCQIDNLEIGTKYYWRINGCEPKSFDTAANLFRFINIDGLHNVRDIGGNNIKQSLLYRGSELERTYQITEKGRYTFANELKIKTEIDLRGDFFGMIDASSAGEGVNLMQLPYRPYTEVFEEKHKTELRAIMDVLSDESNYPVYIHCMGGADRTGIIVLFLRAIAGETDEIIHLDYELTGLSNYALGATEGADGFRNRKSDYYVEFLDMLSVYAPGKPIECQVRAFMRSCKITDECMDKIARIIKTSDDI